MVGEHLRYVAEVDGKWQIVKDSPYNRRFTPDEPMDITGPARGHAMMKTNDDPNGETALGIHCDVCPLPGLVQ